mmetsp:Transcript_3797/g.7836  ORF Transcript_3797/g.7836 Transcript_3797/m.7836 type:complete len:297 (+) Transcript_3797:557-1447(+)
MPAAWSSHGPDATIPFLPSHSPCNEPPPSTHTPSLTSVFTSKRRGRPKGGKTHPELAPHPTPHSAVLSHSDCTARVPKLLCVSYDEEEKKRQETKTECGRRRNTWQKRECGEERQSAGGESLHDKNKNAAKKNRVREAKIKNTRMREKIEERVRVPQAKVRKKQKIEQRERRAHGHDGTTNKVTDELRVSTTTEKVRSPVETTGTKCNIRHSSTHHSFLHSFISRCLSYTCPSPTWPTDLSITNGSEDQSALLESERSIRLHTCPQQRYQCTECLSAAIEVILLIPPRIRVRGALF